MATKNKTTTVTITDPVQLQPALGLRTAMIAAERVTGASAGGVGTTTYVDASGKQIGPAVLITGITTGPKANPVTVALLCPGADPASITEISVPLQSITTSNDLGKLDKFIEEFNLGGDARAATSLTIGDFRFVPDPSVVETTTEAEAAQKKMQN
jgi:hypothetical protein